MLNPRVAAIVLMWPILAFAAEEPKAPVPSGSQTNGSFRKVVLDVDARKDDGSYEDTVKDPLELAIARDGRVFYGQRDGTVKIWKPDSQKTVVAGTLNVFTQLEDGLLGLTLDPKFERNGWIYIYYSIPETGTNSAGYKTGTNRLSRFTVRGDAMDQSSEIRVLDVATLRDPCCHAGGSLAFDARGNLFISTGDNTNPHESDGYAPIDERPGRAAFDAQKSSANPNDLRGKILRIHPEKRGDYTIPKGNLFPPAKSKTKDGASSMTRPEIYVMGNRNPYRISVDQKNGFVYWGEVGPDAGGAKENRGPAGHDEVNQARSAGNFGWPYFVADNKPYFKYDFASKTSGEKFDPLHPVNRSPNNTGAIDLPPAQSSFVAYPSGTSTRFPVVNGPGGRTAMAGPVYYFDRKLKSAQKLPATFDHTLFIYDWSRNWIIAIHLDDKENIKQMERFCPEMTFKRPIDMELGPDGCLYIIEYGTAWGNNKDTQIVRIEYTGNQP